MTCRYCDKPLETLCAQMFGQHVWCYPPPDLPHWEPTVWRDKQYTPEKWAEVLQAAYDSAVSRGKLMGLP